MIVNTSSGVHVFVMKKQETPFNYDVKDCMNAFYCVFSTVVYVHRIDNEELYTYRCLLTLKCKQNTGYKLDRKSVV